MWEVGVAQLMRLPDEVVLVRSDSDFSIFDLTQFRAFRYEPSDVVQSREFLKRLCEDRLRSVDQSRSDHVRRCADAIDPHAATFLLLKIPLNGDPVEIPTNMANALAVPRLFELGILRTNAYVVVPTKIEGKATINAECQITELGKAVAEEIARRMGMWDQIFGQA